MFGVYGKMSVGADVGEWVQEKRFVGEEPNMVGCERARAQTDEQRTGHREARRLDELNVRYVFR